MDNIDIQEYFMKRRTVRRFSDRPLTDAELRRVLTAAAKAPTCGNMQLYSIILTRDPERKELLAKQHFCQPATKAPAILTFCSDFERFTRWCGLRGADAGFDNLESFIAATADAIIFAQQTATIAEMAGMGTCYLGTVTYNAPEIADLLHLPRLCVPVASLAIGWPAEEGEETERLDVDAFLHEETYREDSDDEIINFFKVKEDYPANAGYPAENGKENLAQVFAEVRYPRDMNEEFSAKFADYLRKSGFLNH